MTNTDDNVHDNFYDSELIVEFLQGVLPGDLHFKIQEQIKASKVFRSYVEGVQINFEESGKNFEKMETDIAKKKTRSWLKLQEKLTAKATLSEKLSYTAAQLIDFFRPNTQLELELQPTRAVTTLPAQITVDDTIETLTIFLSKTYTQTIDLELFDNKIQSIQQDKIPAGSDNFALSTTTLRPGIYYAEFRPEGADDYMIRFHIRQDLKPE